jgi:hypothetical protein
MLSQDCVTAHPMVWAAGLAGLLFVFLLLLMLGVRAEYGETKFRTTSPRISRRTYDRLFPPTLILTVVSALLFIGAYAWYQSHPEGYLNPLVPAYDQQRSDPECGHYPKANVLIPGQQHLQFEGFLQCRHEGSVSIQSIRRPLRYMFDLPSDIPDGSKLTGLRGDFFIDKAGGARHQQARVTWDVIYGRNQLCTVAVGWDEIGHCTIPQSVAIEEGATLEITEHVLAKNPNEPLYAGLFHPALQLEKPC